MKKLISKEVAEKEYGVITTFDCGLKYYFTGDGVIDSDGNLRYGKYNGVILNKAPEDWIIANTPTTPVGYNRYWNKKSRWHEPNLNDWCLVKIEEN